MTEPVKPPASQLHMRRDDFNFMPELSIPDGFLCRHFEEGQGDEAGWNQLIELSFERKSGITNFAEEIKDHPQFKADRVWFITTTDGAYAATATAWERDDPREGYLHMVGGHPDFSGQGLGRQVVLAALYQAQKDEYNCMRLQTDDERLAAIKIYFQLGFEPYMRDEDHHIRWHAVKEKLGLTTPPAR